MTLTALNILKERYPYSLIKVKLITDVNSVCGRKDDAFQHEQMPSDPRRRFDVDYSRASARLGKGCPPRVDCVGSGLVITYG